MVDTLVALAAAMLGAKLGTLYFDPASDRSIGAGYTIRDRDLLGKFDRITGTEPDKILWIRVFATPLASVQSSLGLMFHAYVVIETERYYYSLEKSDRNITLQRSHDEYYVCDKQLRVSRKSTRSSDEPECVAEGKGKGNIRDVLEFLYNEDLLCIRYKLLDDNCKHFAKKIFDKFNCEGERWNFLE